MDKIDREITKTTFSQKIALLILSIFLTMVILELGLRLGGLLVLSFQESKNIIAISKKESCRVLCLGESTTMGQYPNFLENPLAQENPGISFSIIDKGLGGTTTLAILSRVQDYLNLYRPDIVVVMMGINDDSLHMPREFVANPRLFKSFRVYKLFKLILLHVVTKLNEASQADFFFGGDQLRSFFIDGKDVLLNDVVLKYKKALRINPKDDAAYAELGDFYLEHAKISKAKESCAKSLEINPQNEFACICLGKFYQTQTDFLKAEEMYKKAISLNPKNLAAYYRLERMYQAQGRLAESQEVLKKAIEVNPDNELAYIKLGDTYREQGKLLKAKEEYQKVAALYPQSYKINKSLELLCREMGDLKLADSYRKKVEALNLSYYGPSTINNYKQLRDILRKRNIIFVCVQYPMRSVDQIKSIFKNDADGIIFVDNEKIFKEALEKASYSEYFIDTFGGDFGHCTERGNRLLAQNIADTITKELFKEDKVNR